MLLLNYYISPDYNSLLNVRCSLLSWCKIKSFLLKQQSKNLTAHWEPIQNNQSIPIQHTASLCKNISEDSSLTLFLQDKTFCICSSRAFPFLKACSCSKVWLLLFFIHCSSAASVSSGKPTGQPFIVGIFMSHYELGQIWGKPFFFPGGNSWARRQGRALFKVKAGYLVLTVSCAAAVVAY